MTVVVKCINCDGRGYVYERSFIDNMKRPKKCPGCNGTGEQKVRGT